MTVEVLHYRDPDGGCDVRVFIDGEEVATRIEDVDPGRGHVRWEWDAHTAELRIDDDLSPGFVDAVLAARDFARESEYVEEGTAAFRDAALAAYDSTHKEGTTT